jgi:hypothetical protein
MQNNPRSSQHSAQSVAPALDLATLERVIHEEPSPEAFCAAAAKLFRVRKTEVALLRLEKSLLKFIVPGELASAGAIPISSSAVAAHTASTKKSELFNGFANVKHASIFEMIKLSAADENDRSEQAPIQKLMSAPVVDQKEHILGVLQVCRKGFDLRNTGPDFTSDDLLQLERAAKVLARADFMQVNR